MSGHHVTAKLSLAPTEKGGLQAALPSGTPSLIIEFREGGVLTQLGAVVKTRSGGPLEPGMGDVTVELQFWADEARIYASPGTTFGVWYGGPIGHGRVESLIPPFDEQGG